MRRGRPRRGRRRPHRGTRPRDRSRPSIRYSNGEAPSAVPPAPVLGPRAVAVLRVQEREPQTGIGDPLPRCHAEQGFDLGTDVGGGRRLAEHLRVGDRRDPARRSRGSRSASPGPTPPGSPPRRFRCLFPVDSRPLLACALPPAFNAEASPCLSARGIPKLTWGTDDGRRRARRIASSGRRVRSTIRPVHSRSGTGSSRRPRSASARPPPRRS